MRVRHLFIAVVAALALIAPIAAVTPVAQAAPVLGCNDEPVEMKPYASPPFKYSKRKIHFGIAEWHFPPSCNDEMKRDWVKVYKIKKGKDPRVFYTKSQSDRWGNYVRKFPKGTYRVKVKWSYRYYQGDGKYGNWHSFYRTKKIKLR